MGGPGDAWHGSECRIGGDDYGVPRGRCSACGSCRLWQRCRTSGPFAPQTCNRCGCATRDHEDLSSWLGQVLERSGLDAQSVLREGIPLDAYSALCPLGIRLTLETNGLFSPLQHGRHKSDASPSRPPPGSARRPLCSVICPTTCQRHAFHPLLYQCYLEQSYQPKELVVIDTGREPSVFLQQCIHRDPTLVYRWFQDVDWSIGLKRNIACFLAEGEVILHFDDDDMYAKTYLGRMVTEVLALARQGRGTARGSDAGGRSGKAKGAACAEKAGKSSEAPAAARLAAVTLSSWHVYDTQDRCFRFLTAVSDRWVYGWGFSFAYTKQAWKACYFPDENVGEDYEFMKRMQAHPSAVVLAMREKAAICSHTYHPHLSVSGGEMTRDRQKLGEKVPPPEHLKILLEKLLMAEAQAKQPKQVAVPHLPRDPPAKDPRAKELAEPAPVVLTVSTATEIVELLTVQYCSPQFQAELRRAWDAAGGDRKKQNLARLKICAPLQLPVISKYGFEASTRGVYDSVNAFKVLGSGGDHEFEQKCFFLNWLCSPDLQRQSPQGDPWSAQLHHVQRSLS